MSKFFFDKKYQFLKQIEEDERIDFFDVDTVYIGFRCDFDYIRVHGHSVRVFFWDVDSKGVEGVIFCLQDVDLEADITDENDISIELENCCDCELGRTFTYVFYVKGEPVGAVMFSDKSINCFSEENNFIAAEIMDSNGKRCVNFFFTVDEEFSFDPDLLEDFGVKLT